MAAGQGADRPQNGGPIVEGTCFPPGRRQQSGTDQPPAPRGPGGDWKVRCGRYVPRSSWEIRTPVSIDSFPYTSSKCPGFLPILSHPLLSHPWPSPPPLRVCWALRTLGCHGGPQPQALRANSWSVQKKEAAATLSPAPLLTPAWTGQGQKASPGTQVKKGNGATAGLWTWWRPSLEIQKSVCSIEKSPSTESQNPSQGFTRQNHIC